jgi:hypothetical protein
VWETAVEEAWKRCEDMSGHVRIEPNDTHSTPPNTDIEKEGEEATEEPHTEETLTEKHTPAHAHTHTHTHTDHHFFSCWSMKCSLSLSSNSLLHRKGREGATERDEKETQKMKETERGYRK